MSANQEDAPVEIGPAGQRRDLGDSPLGYIGDAAVRRIHHDLDQRPNTASAGGVVDGAGHVFTDDSGVPRSAPLSIQASCRARFTSISPGDLLESDAIMHAQVTVVVHISPKLIGVLPRPFLSLCRTTLWTYSA